MRAHLLIHAAAFAILLHAAPAMAKKDSADRLATPAIVQQLVACRDIAADAERLACYDKQVLAFDTATKSRDIVIADKVDVRSARKGLFGFKLPSLNIFGNGRDEDEEITEIASTIASARPTRDGQWRIVLADGAVWEQVSTDHFVLGPRPGNPVKIKQAALGSYKVSVDGQPSVRMRRVE
ncbi:MAG: hypothetical protein B7Z39_02105 [Novosphingobium sp. 12-64-8]|nr:MAG: hypothetical protein B7Z39_02105 [Novosphingobium sp. 12-64-8]